MINCEFCSSILKSETNLKLHLSNSKKCLKLRGLQLETKFICKGCNKNFMNNVNLAIHCDSCKEYGILMASQEIINEKNQLLDIIKNKDKQIDDFQKIINENKDYKEILYFQDLKYTKLEVKYEELEKQHEDLKEQHEKTINKLEMKISQCDSFIQTIAREGSNKVTTTNNTVNNIRNQLSSTYTLDKLEPKKLEDTMREHYTEHDFFGGQKRLANFFFEKVIKTPDDKMLICCTDTSRKKFKILDLRGNMKEDIEARTLCEKLKVPTQMITKEIYDKVVDRIDIERDRLSSDDRSRREKLLDDTMRAQQVFIDNMNFDDLNYNQDFMHELCVLLNV